MLELLSKEELYEIKGGFLSMSAIAAIMGGVMFIIGLIDGYTRPLKCRRV